ncbi:MAG: glycosyltransferase family 39 protein [Flavobacteriales bacterium]|nr:glycosyltransferase family 39 protein [Flavobacteriales bacterium]
MPSWCWTQLFGFGDGAVKAPFILMSVLALFFLYRVMHAWTSSTAAPIGTALMASMQYTVMYGQIARPYAMGFFTTALLTSAYVSLGTGNENTSSGWVFRQFLVRTRITSLMLAAFICITGAVLGQCGTTQGLFDRMWDHCAGLCTEHPALLRATRYERLGRMAYVAKSGMGLGLCVVDRPLFSLVCLGAIDALLRFALLAHQA